MDKEYITERDISTLIKESKKLKPGETKIGKISEQVISPKYGEPKVVSNFISEESNNTKIPEIINISGTTEDLESDATYEIKGEAYPASFIEDTKPKKFSLKRTFFNALDKLEQIHEKINLKLINLGQIIYYSDELGRIYFKDTNNNIYYINKKKDGCLSSDGLYGHLIPTKDGYEIEFDEAIDTSFFDYLYITKKREANDISYTAPTEDYNPYRDLFYSDGPKSKVIDITSYLNQDNNGPRR